MFNGTGDFNGIEMNNCLSDEVITDQFNLFDYINTDEDNGQIHQINPSGCWNIQQNHVLSGNEMFIDPNCIDRGPASNNRAVFAGSISDDFFYSKLQASAPAPASDLTVNTSNHSSPSLSSLLLNNTSRPPKPDPNHLPVTKVETDNLTTVGDIDWSLFYPPFSVSDTTVGTCQPTSTPTGYATEFPEYAVPSVVTSNITYAVTPAAEYKRDSFSSASSTSSYSGSSFSDRTQQFPTSGQIETLTPTGGTAPVTPNDSEGVTSLWESTYHHDHSGSIVSLDSGHWSLASSPERKYYGCVWDRPSNRYSVTNTDVPAALLSTASIADASTSGLGPRRITPSVKQTTRASRSEVRGSTGSHGAARHKRSSHIRAEKKRKAKIESELETLNRLILMSNTTPGASEITGGSESRSRSNSDAGTTRRGQSERKSASRAGQLNAAADKIRELNKQINSTDKEISTLKNEKNENMQILKSMWESIDVKNQPGTPILSPTERMNIYLNDNVNKFGASFEIFQELLSPMTQILTDKMTTDTLPQVKLTESLVEAVSEESLFASLRQSCMAVHTKLLQRFDS